MGYPIGCCLIQVACVGEHAPPKLVAVIAGPHVGLLASKFWDKASTNLGALQIVGQISLADVLRARVENDR